jgi:transcriptional regulator with XRE-family HTH domain
MAKHKALLIQEGLTFDELSDRIKTKIQRYNNIENSKEFRYRSAKTGMLTAKAISEMEELDNDICDLVDVFVSDREDEINRVENERIEAERIEQQRLADEEAERVRLEQEEINKNNPPPPPPPVDAPKKVNFFDWLFDF